jgi:hypothetical protein
MALRLLDMVAPLEPVEFPNGRTFAVRPLDADSWEMLRAVQESKDGGKALALLKRVVPDASEEDFASLGIPHVGALLSYAANQIDLTLAAIKNSSGGAAADKPTPPSSP